MLTEQEKVALRVVKYRLLGQPERMKAQAQAQLLQAELKVWEALHGR